MDSITVKNNLVNSINSTKVSNFEVENKVSFNINFICNPFVEVKGNSDDIFRVEFIDNNKVIHSSDIRCNMWTKCFRSYYTSWRIKITNLSTNVVEFNDTLSLRDRRVYISIESKSLGDTLAWFPYVEEFRKKHKCKLIVSTFLNNLFTENYPEIEFVNPGSIVSNIFAQYRIGWFYDGDKFSESSHPCDPKSIPLQKTSSDILGLDYKEIKPKLKFNASGKRKKVGIGFHSTTQAKYWNNSNGWQDVVDYLVNMGYECVIYSREQDGYMNNFYPKKTTIFAETTTQNLINDLVSCEFFIGLGSGLSWLAWACDLPVILISGFSKKWAETSSKTYRVINENTCNGCFNIEKLDPSDWYWCPFHKNTERQFECTKEISSKQVIEEINRVISGEQNQNIQLYQNEEPTEIPGWFSYSKVYDLFVKEATDGSTIVEIGSWFGKSTKYLIDKIDQSRKKINLEVIDTFKGSLNEDLHQQIVKDFDNDIYQKFYDNIGIDSNITIHKNFSKDSSELFNNESIDFILIDGDHSYEGVTSDINSYFHKVKSGGIIAGDDYNVFDGTTKAVNEFFIGAHSLYENNYNWIYKKPRIQIIHISTLPIQNRTKKSIKNFEILKRYGFDLKMIQSDIYSGDIDVENYANPNNPNLKPTHYGCYLGHTNALRQIDDHNYDFTLVLEEDAYIYSSTKEFVDIVYKAIFTCQTNKSVAYVSLGSDIWLDKSEHNQYFDECWHQILAHCYLVPNYHKNWYIHKIETEKWDSADLWYNQIFERSDKKRLVSKNTFSKQLNGVSIIDGIFKDYANDNYGPTPKKTVKKSNPDTDFEWGNTSTWFRDTMKKEIFSDRIYEKLTPVEENDIVVDFGASIGPFVKTILDKKPKHIYTFEPCEEEFEILEKNIVGENITHLNYGVSFIDSDYVINTNIFSFKEEKQISMKSLTFKSFINKFEIEHIDFLKTDCEGGEYDIFNTDNLDWITKNVYKIAGEWHLNKQFDENAKEKFRNFRDTYLSKFKKVIVHSVDGHDITWDLWNEHFIEYYNEVIIYIDNRD